MVWKRPFSDLVVGVIYTKPFKLPPVQCYLQTNASSIAQVLGVPGQSKLILFLAVILAIDAIAAIPFARLRLENKPITFALAKLGAIVCTILLNLIFLVVPDWIDHNQSMQWLAPVVQWYQIEGFGVGYVFLANLLGNSLILIFLGKYLLQIGPQLKWSQIKPLLIYGLPIFFMGLAGIANEQADKLLIPALLPDNFYPGKSSMAALGIYGASFKLSIFMLLAIQAFRYAGEPFFFAQAQNKKAPELFAKVLYYFVITCCFILIAVSLNLNLIGNIFLRQASYREALYLVPILLMGKLLFGVYVNLSIWFKLVDKTLVGTYISLIGACITVVLNVILIPQIGYLGSALASVACYGGMSTICYYWGRNYFPVPYRWKAIFVYLLVSLVLVYATPMLYSAQNWWNNTLNLLIPLSFVGIVYLVEKRNIYTKTP